MLWLPSVQLTMAVLKSPNKWKKRNSWKLIFISKIKKSYNVNKMQQAKLSVNLNKKITKKKLYIKTYKHWAVDNTYSNHSGMLNFLLAFKK